MILDSNFLEFIDCLNRNKANYVLVGGYAVIINGHSRTTQDLDLFIRRTEENVQKVLKAIDDFGFGSIGFTSEDLMDESTIVQMGVPPLRIDILSAIPGVSFDEVINQSKDYEESGIVMKVIHINHLIANKLAVGRNKDMADVSALKRIINKK
jgi:predicted nucleotidyltransferase